MVSRKSLRACLAQILGEQSERQPAEVDHYQAVNNMYFKLGNTKVNALYPSDHTHTSPEGADLVAQAFVEAIGRDYNGTTPLKSYVKTPVPVVF